MKKRLSVERTLAVMEFQNSASAMSFMTRASSQSSVQPCQAADHSAFTTVAAASPNSS